MSDQENGQPDDLQSWTGKRKAELVLEIFGRKVSIAEACRRHSLLPGEIEEWMQEGTRAMENALSSLPSNQEEIFKLEVKEQQANVGELSSAESEQADGLRPQFLKIPVLFITDRNLAPPKGQPDVVDFGAHRKYIGDCQHDCFMGDTYCVVPNIEGKQLTKRLRDLGWAAAKNNEKEGSFKASLLSGDNFKNIEQNFYSKVHEQSLRSADHNVFLFVHGYKNSFKAALYKAAHLAYYAERPMIFYSWPSVSRLQAYSSDENNCEWSQEHFNEVVTKLTALYKADPSFKVRLVTHSMGARLAVRAAPLLREQPWAVELSLVCPDIDDGLVRHYTKRYLSAKGTATIRVYMSHRDQALAISQFFHGGYARLGECAKSFWELTTHAGTGGDTGKNDPELLALLEKTKHRMQTINFTSIDSGPMGHKVPAKLLCSMSFTNAPPPELKLIPEKLVHRNKISQLISKAMDLTSPEELSIKGDCLLVVPDKSYKGQPAKIPVPPLASDGP